MRPTARLAATLALLLLAASSAPSVAAGPDTRRAPRARASKAAPVKPSNGREEFDQAVALFQAERYAEALPLFEQAYTLSGQRASSIRALAQCVRVLGDLPRAIELFEAYVATTPAPSDAAAIAETIAELRRELAAKDTPPIAAPPPTPPAPPPSAAAPLVATPPPPPEPGLRWGPLVGVGASTLLTAGGVTLFALGKSDAAAVEGAAPGSAFADVRDAADRGPALMTAGTVMAGVGVAALAATVYWLVSTE